MAQKLDVSGFRVIWGTIVGGRPQKPARGVFGLSRRTFRRCSHLNGLLVTHLRNYRRIYIAGCAPPLVDWSSYEDVGSSGL